tara:strand:+ start:106 stop:348 length:243 start_codon:yes stop_codon:yes gene_type:complete
MELPRIPNNQLSDELKELVGDADLVFDPVVDLEDVVDIQIDPDAYYEGSVSVGRMLIESRKKQEELNEIQRHNQRSKEDS